MPVQKVSVLKGETWLHVSKFQLIKKVFQITLEDTL